MKKIEAVIKPFKLDDVKEALNGIGVNGMDPLDLPDALTPDDVFAGATLSGDVVIYDDEHYFMAGALAEKLARAGHSVTLVTPNPTVSSWTAMTDEQGFLQARLHEIELPMQTGRLLRVLSDAVAEKTAQEWDAYPDLASRFLSEIRATLDDESPDYAT